MLVFANTLFAIATGHIGPLEGAHVHLAVFDTLWIMYEVLLAGEPKLASYRSSLR